MDLIQWFETNGVVPLLSMFALAVVLIYLLGRLCGRRVYFTRHSVEGWGLMLFLLFFASFFGFFPAYAQAWSWAGPFFLVTLVLTILSTACLAFVLGCRHG